MGTVDVVFGEVIRIHVRDDVLTPEGKIDIARIAPIARLGYYDYAVIRETFEMRIPALNPDVLVGLEGRREAR
jgi:flavin reductase (DIM6/NTAB) family NADH-FMN oxidoreductase RutF